jgi:prophage tail gpP-like protein
VSERNRGVVSLHTEDGTKFFTWTSFSMRDTYTDPLSDLDFEVKPPGPDVKRYRTLLAKGEAVTIRINDIPQGTFIIQTLQTRLDRQGAVTLSVKCQTPLVTLVQGSVNPDLSFRGQTDVPVSKVILDAFAPYTPPVGDFWAIAEDQTAHVDAITGKRRDGKKQPLDVETLKHQEAHAQDGESAYNFAARIFMRLGVLLRMAADGTLNVGSPDYDQAPLYTIAQTVKRVVSGADRTIGEIDIVDTNDQQYSSCTVRGQGGDKRGQTRSARPEAIIQASNQFTNRVTYKSSTAAPFKPLILMDKRSRDAERCTNRAIRALGSRGKDAFSITVTVDGVISSTGVPWQVDTVARVIIEAIGLDEPMWILERTMMLSRDGGQSTRIKLIPLGALVLGDE